jgi:hypothetical protein
MVGVEAGRKFSYVATRRDGVEREHTRGFSHGRWLDWLAGLAFLPRTGRGLWRTCGVWDRFGGVFGGLY